MTRRTLLITNDFPPRPGGIQTFIHNLAVRQPQGALVVYASQWPGADDFDKRQPYPVIRESTKMLLPTPAVARRATRIAHEYECDAVWFGAAAPLGLLADGLRRRSGIDRVIAQTHGHEIGWAALPGARSALRRIGRSTDVVTYLGDYTRVRLEPVLGDVTNLQRLAPGVNTDEFHPRVSGEQVRQECGLAGRPVIVCVSRLVPRKGQDMLIKALPRIRRRVPDAALLMVGGGPDYRRLRILAGDTPGIVLTGSVPWERIPHHFAAGDVYAMPCRTRRAGLDVEGLGIVYLEASAMGLPVVAGRSGGAPDAVREGETGFVVDGGDINVIADRIVTLLRDDVLAKRMGEAGRRWVEAEWGWGRQADRMCSLLTGD